MSTHLRKHTVVIDAEISGGSHRLRELWDYRELLFFLAWRDVKVRYKQTVLGAAWAIIQPLFTMIVFTIFLGRLARVPSDGLPYPLFVLCALLPWQFFANSLTEASNSLVNNQNLITKVYFPRLVIPFAPILAGLVDFAIAFGLLLCGMWYYGVVPGLAALFWIPVLLLMTLLTALGVVLWSSALNVQYRDVRYTIPFLTQIWMYATPVVYPASLVPEPWRALFGINPMAGVIEGFRAVLLGAGPAPGLLLLVSALSIVIIVYGGLRFFQKMEKSFADVL